MFDLHFFYVEAILELSSRSSSDSRNYFDIVLQRDKNLGKIINMFCMQSNTHGPEFLVRVASLEIPQQDLTIMFLSSPLGRSSSE